MGRNALRQVTVTTLVCRYCDREQDIEEFSLIGEKGSRRRDRRCKSCHDKIPLVALYERDNRMCGICHKHVPRPHASIDHIIPLSKGGKHEWENVQLAHRRCNHLKGGTAPWEATHFGR